MSQVAWPPINSYLMNAGPSSGAMTIDAANEVAAMIFKAPKTGNIRSVWYRPGIGGNGTITIGVYQVDPTTGLPASTPVPWATNTFVSKSIVTGDNSRACNSGNFAADAAVVKGQDTIAVCFICPGAGFPNMTVNTWQDSVLGLPYCALYTGSWAKVTASPFLILVYDDGSFAIPDGCAFFGQTSGTIAGVPENLNLTSATTPDLYGLRFQVPTWFRAHAIVPWLDADADCNVKIVDDTWAESSGGLLATGTLDPDVRSGTGANPHVITLNQDVVLQPGKWYRVLIEPTTTNGMTVYWAAMMDAAHWAAMPAGVLAHASFGKSVNGNSGWTDYNNTTDGFRMAFIYLLGDFLPTPTELVGGGLAA